MAEVATPTNSIYADGLTKVFAGTTVVNDLHLEVPSGAIFGFIGPSGCGKTTSVRLLVGIYTPTSGNVTVLQKDPQNFGRAERAQIGYMPQQFVLYPELSVWENLNFAASLYGVPLRRKERLNELLELVELNGHESKKVRDLSGGMQRRLSLAASIVHDPQLIFLDEPTSGIDPVLRRKFWDYFQQLKAEGHTLFITTQYVSEAAYCDYVGIMANGRLLMVETPQGLRRRALGGDVLHLHTKNVMDRTTFASLQEQPFVLGKVNRLRDHGVEIVVDDASVALPILLDWCHSQDIGVESASEYVPVFDDVFVELIRQETAEKEEMEASNVNKLANQLWQAIIRIFSFVGKEVRTILHQPRLVFSLILGPFLILLIFGLGYRDTPRTLTTLFVVPEGSELQAQVEAYATSLGSRIEFAGIVHDAAEADRRLRDHEVDLVVVTPGDPMADWENDEQSKFALYHSEIDPYEEVYIQVLGQRYAEEINQQVLLTALSSSQEDANQWENNVAEAKTQAASVRQALEAGDTAVAHASAEELKNQLTLLELALGSGAGMLASLEEANGQSGTTSELLHEMETVQSQIDEVMALTENETSTALSEGQATAADIENSLEEVDSMLETFQDIDPTVLVAPFRSETLSITEAQMQPMHFYIPGVIALLLQHLAITLAGLSVIREKLRGAMEIFRAAPVTAFEMLFGKYLSYTLIIGSLAAVLTALVVYGLGMPQLGPWGNYILVILALILASLGIGFHISLSARSDSQAIQYGMLTLLASIFFSGFFLPLYRLSLFVRFFSWLLPATYGTVLLQDVMLRGEAPQALLTLALYGFALIVLLLAWFRLARQMRRE